MRRRRASKSATALAVIVIIVAAASACGYHTVGHAGALPPDIHTIAIPAFVSHSQTFRMEQLLTDAVIREFDTRTQFKVVHDARDDSDAVLIDCLTLFGANLLDAHGDDPDGLQARIDALCRDFRECAALARETAGNAAKA